MSVSETLNKAADLIETRGWEKGSSAWRPVGEDSPLCLEGGIIAALGWTDGLRELSTCPAYRAVMEYLEPTYDFKFSRANTFEREPRLWDWNDDEIRTAAEVIEVLRAAAVIEESREAQSIIAAANALDAPVAVGARA